MNFEPPPLGTIGVTPTYGNGFDKFVGSAIRYMTATQRQYQHGTYGPVWIPSKVNHAVIYVGHVNSEGSFQLVEARPGGAGFRPWTAYGENMIWLTEFGQRQLDGKLLRVRPTDSQRAMVAATAISLAQRKIGYNYEDFLGIALAQKRVGSPVDVVHPPWWVKTLANNHRMICSQLCDYSWGQAGLQLYVDQRLPGLVSPGDLLQLGL